MFLAEFLFTFLRRKFAFQRGRTFPQLPAHGAHALSKAGMGAVLGNLKALPGAPGGLSMPSFHAWAGLIFI